MTARRHRSTRPESELPEETYPCPDCGDGDDRRFRSSRALSAHRRLKHGTGPQVTAAAQTRTSAGSSRTSAATEAALRGAGDQLVTNLSFVAMLVGSGLPHVGLTIMARTGDRHVVGPDGQAVQVNGRPVVRRGIASIAMAYAARDERVYRGIVRFNRLFELSDELDILGSLVAAVAADTGVDPEAELSLGPLGTVQPIMQFIPDVVDQLRTSRDDVGDQVPDENAGAGAYPNGTQVPGGVVAT